MCNELVLAYEEPSDTRDTKIDALRLKFMLLRHLQDSDSDVEEDNRTNNEFMADLNTEYQERAQLANQKRLHKRSERVGSARKSMDKSKESCFSCEKLGKSDRGKSEKGLIVESFDWDDESISSEDEYTTKFKAFMEIAKDEPSVGKTDARSGQWVKITMKKVHRLLSMTDGEERKHVLDYTHVDLHYVEDQ
ncbi:hypothetical protein Tco_1040468, partial [Tanacetum coccineum]